MPRKSSTGSPNPEPTNAEGLKPQGLRLHPSTRVLLVALASELRRALGSRSSVSEVARGLCMLALQCCQGAAGSRIAHAFRIAAGDPTDEGVRRALRELRVLDDSVLVEHERTERSPVTRPTGCPSSPPPPSH
jgi:hypothetical protein